MKGERPNNVLMLQFTQASACEAFQFWVDKHFKTPMKVTHLMLRNRAVQGDSLFEILLEPTADD
jgi:hypothetical protein